MSSGPIARTPARAPGAVAPELEREFQPQVLIVPSTCLAFQRTIGGGERYALEYAKALSALTPTTHALFDTQESTEMEGSLVHRTFRLSHREVRLHFPLSAAARRELRHYDLLHLMWFPTPMSDLLLLLARWRGQKVVLTDVGGLAPCYSTYLSRIHPRLALSRLAHGLAHLSVHASTFFSSWPQPKTELFGGASSKVVGAPQSPGGYALFVGRLLRHKGVLQLIQAIPPGLPLHIIGRPYAPEYFQELQAAARGKEVTFITDADDATVQREYARASVVLQPSIPAGFGADDKSELLGLVALEAMASGKPVIVTSVTSLPELVRDGVTGFIVPPHDLSALADRIQRLVRDPELSLRLGTAAARHVRENFTWAETARRGMALYRRLLPSPLPSKHGLRQ